MISGPPPVMVISEKNISKMLPCLRYYKSGFSCCSNSILIYSNGGRQNKRNHCEVTYMKSVMLHHNNHENIIEVLHHNNHENIIKNVTL